MSLRIIFAGTPDFASAILKTLLNSPHSVAAVYTQPDRPAGRGRVLQASSVKTLALQHHIPIYQPESLKKITEQEILAELNPDLLIVVAYGLILPARILSIPKYGCINIHASLLPRWRGAAPIQHAILAGDTETGISMMQMDEGLDTGDVLSTYRCSISQTETSLTLHDKLATLASQALIDTLEALEENLLVPKKQDPTYTTYASKITKLDAKIIWHESAHIIDQKIRAYNPSPVAFTEFSNQTVRIWAAKPTDTLSSAHPGTLLKIEKDYLEIATGLGTLQITELQLPGGKRVSVRDCLNAKKDFFQENTLCFH